MRGDDAMDGPRGEGGHASGTSPAAGGTADYCRRYADAGRNDVVPDGPGPRGPLPAARGLARRALAPTPDGLVRRVPAVGES